MVFALALAGGPALAQGAQISLGSDDYDSSLPVEISADGLQIDQTTGEAVFSGNVVVGQGEMRLTGDRVDVRYATGDRSEIERIHARGNVTMTTATEAAEAAEAVYTLATGVVVMTGDVVVTQGGNAMTGEKLTVNLDTGTGVMEGRVRVLFQPQSSQ